MGMFLRSQQSLSGSRKTTQRHVPPGKNKVNKKKDRFKKKSFKILHIITTLERGGAQKILTQICNPKENKNLQHLIICLANKTDYSQRLVFLNVY